MLRSLLTCLIAVGLVALAPGAVLAADPPPNMPRGQAWCEQFEQMRLRVGKPRRRRVIQRQHGNQSPIVHQRQRADSLRGQRRVKAVGT